MKCAWCAKPIGKNEEKLVFARSLYYHNYKRSTSKTVEWHLACYEDAERKAEVNRANLAEELRKEIQAMRDSGEINMAKHPQKSETV